MKYFLLLAVVIRLLFYISAGFSHSLDKFFLPVTPGQDFFQIPNAAYSFLHAGDLQGHIGNLKNVYINCCGVNENVYHPLFTLLVGVPLQFLKPWIAFYTWFFLHLAVDAFLAVFIYLNFKKNRYILLALSLYLLSNFYYYEILNNQFHFLLNLFTFLLVFEISKGKDSFAGGIYYFLSLLVKPIGLLWLLPLVLAKRFKTVLLGFSLFLVFTLPWWFIPVGQYYFNNLFYTLKNTYPDWNIFYVFSFSDPVVKIAVALLLLALSLFKKIKPNTAIFLWIIYSLTMYQNTFPYHYSILAAVLPLALLAGQIRFNLLDKITAFLLTAPAPIFITSLDKSKFIFVAWSVLAVFFFAASLLVRNFSNSYEKK